MHVPPGSGAGADDPETRRQAPPAGHPDRPGPAGPGCALKLVLDRVGETLTLVQAGAASPADRPRRPLPDIGTGGVTDRQADLDQSDPVADLSSELMSIIASISGPPVRRKRQMRAAARARKMTLRTEV